ncbi:22275_t:CDS:2, partial [Gigaspora rosea]
KQNERLWVLKPRIRIGTYQFTNRTRPVPGRVIETPQSMDIDKVYLINLLQWGDLTTGLEFKEEINYTTSGIEDTSSPGIKPGGIPALTMA